MQVLEAISRRRSIRSFCEAPVDREIIEKVLSAAVLAPSAKNLQPWRFVVLQGAARAKLARLMEQGADFAEKRGDSCGSCRTGVIFDHLVYNAPDILSIGAMVQNVLLASEDLGVGTLWICDILYAYPLIREWLNRDEELVTAVSLGFAETSPAARPRTPWQELTEWRESE